MKHALLLVGIVAFLAVSIREVSAASSSFASSASLENYRVRRHGPPKTGHGNGREPPHMGQGGFPGPESFPGAGGSPGAGGFPGADMMMGAGAQLMSMGRN